MLKKTLAALTMTGALAFAAPVAPASAQSVCVTIYVFVNGMTVVDTVVCVPPQG